MTKIFNEHEYQTIIEFAGRNVDYIKLYENITGEKADKKEWRLTGKISGLSITEFVEANNLDIECWDKI